MISSLPTRLAAAGVILAIIFSSPAHSQKVLAEGIKDLATQIATNVSKQNKQKVAILPFRELDGKSTILGTYVSEELVTDLFMIGGIEIVERTMLDRLLGEIKLGQTGVIDPETAQKVGKVAGVDAIVTGTITDLQSYVALNCRLIDAQTGRIFGAAQTRIVKDDDTRKIMGAALPSPGGDGGQPPRPTPSKPGLQQQRSGNLLFELRGCSLAGSLVNCEFLVTNSGDDLDVALYCEMSRLFDAGGNEYHAEQATIGSSSVNRVYPKAWSRLASDIPVRAQLKFDGIPPEAQRATLVELHTEFEGKEHTVQFRNVPLVRL